MPENRTIYLVFKSPCRNDTNQFEVDPRCTEIIISCWNRDDQFKIQLTSVPSTLFLDKVDSSSIVVGGSTIHDALILNWWNSPLCYQGDIHSPNSPSSQCTGNTYSTCWSKLNVVDRTGSLVVHKWYGCFSDIVWPAENTGLTSPCSAEFNRHSYLRWLV